MWFDIAQRPRNPQPESKVHTPTWYPSHQATGIADSAGRFVSTPRKGTSPHTSPPPWGEDTKLGARVANRWLVTKKKQKKPIAERPLGGSQEGLLKAIYQAIPDVILTTSESGQIESCNNSIEGMFGYSPDETLRLNLMELFASPHKEEIGKRMASYISGGTSAEILITRRLEATRKDGSIFPVSLSAAETIYKERHHFAYSIRDITKILHAEKELETLSRELGRSNSELQQFASVASHDLQAPLRTVASLAKFLANALDEPDEFFHASARDRVHRIIKSTERMQKLVKSLLDLSRLNSAAPAFESVAMNEIFQEVTSDLATSIAEAKAKVTSANLPEVHGDKESVRQLLQNLIGNAIKFRQKNADPVVHVSCVEGAHGFTFSVRDNGIGIEPIHHNRIFDLFQKLHGANEYPGSGLGLAICKKIAERHGGVLKVESQQGNGTCFIFTFSRTPTPSKP